MQIIMENSLYYNYTVAFETRARHSVCGKHRYFTLLKTTYVFFSCLWSIRELNVMERTILAAMASLEDSWKEATEGLDAAVCDSWFTRLQELYSEEKRTYHNLDSLREKLNHYYEIKSNLKNPRAVLLAIFFQKWVATIEELTAAQGYLSYPRLLLLNWIVILLLLAVTTNSKVVLLQLRVRS